MIGIDGHLSEPEDGEIVDVPAAHTHQHAALQQSASSMQVHDIKAATASGSSKRKRRRNRQKQPHSDAKRSESGQTHKEDADQKHIKRPKLDQDGPAEDVADMHVAKSAVEMLFGAGITTLTAPTGSNLLIDEQQAAPAEPDQSPQTAQHERKRRDAQAGFKKQKHRHGSSKDQAAKQNVVCTFWTNYSCNNGNSCRFLHVGPGGDRRSAQVCRFFKSGSCVQGSQCPFSHDLKQEPCVFFHLKQDKGGCRQGDACPFSHDPMTEEQQQRLEREQVKWVARKRCGSDLENQSDGKQTAQSSLSQLLLLQPSSAVSSPDSRNEIENIVEL